MTDSSDRSARAAMSARRQPLASDTHDAFEAFSRQVFAAGALGTQTKQLVAYAHSSLALEVAQAAAKRARESHAPRDAPESD